MSDGEETTGAVATLARQVAARAPLDGREARSIHRALVALGRLERPFDRAGDPTHVTGSAVVVGEQGVLLHLHRRLGLWLQPGGHLEPGETPFQAARREGEEETGLSLVPAGGELLHVDVHEGGRGHIHLDMRYRFSVSGCGDPKPPAGESQEVRWYSWDEAVEVADPGIAGLLRSIRPG